MKKNYQCHFDFDEVSGGAISKARVKITIEEL